MTDRDTISMATKNTDSTSEPMVRHGVAVARHFTRPGASLGYDGGAGVGSGPGMAVGAALAFRNRPELPVAMLGDGDCSWRPQPCGPLHTMLSRCWWWSPTTRRTSTTRRTRRGLRERGADRWRITGLACVWTSPRSILPLSPSRWESKVLVRSSGLRISHPRSPGPFAASTKGGRWWSMCVFDASNWSD